MKIRSVIGSTLILLFASGSTAAGATSESAETPVPTSSSEICVAYAEQEHSSDDWACVSSVLYVKPSNSNEAASEIKNFNQPTLTKNQDEGSPQPLAIVNESYSNTTEPIVASVGNVSYTVPVNLKVSLYNHSPKVDTYYTSETPVSLTWNMRIQQDVAFDFDPTTFNYSSVYGSSFYTTYGGVYSESQYGEAFDVLPRDGSKYFIDLYNVSLKTPSGNLSILGSVQSDRMTCYKTVACKFR